MYNLHIKFMYRQELTMLRRIKYSWNFSFLGLLSPFYMLPTVITNITYGSIKMQGQQIAKTFTASFYPINAVTQPQHSKVKLLIVNLCLLELYGKLTISHRHMMY